MNPIISKKTQYHFICPHIRIIELFKYCAIFIAILIN